jgi:predicted MFS family arabinose efflux permease
MLMALNQAMIFSFLERMGADCGLDRETVQGVLLALGLVAVTPAPLAALLERRLSAIKVGIGGAVAQGVIALLISCSSGFLPYAIGAILFPFVMLFTHTFIFGHLARIEPTGRAVAATPAMIMSGSTIAPLFGGVLVQVIGYPALGVAAIIFSLIAAALYGASRKFESLDTRFLATASAAR